jgi:prepilin peptidase CpaA
MPAAIEAARWIVAGLFAINLFIASLSDIRYRRIPNWSVVVLLVLFIPWIFVGPEVSLPLSLAAFAIFFAVGVALYAFGIWGAGDSKLIAAVALFVGWDRLLLFLFATAVCGGILALAIILLHSPRVVTMLKLRRAEDSARNVPYGVAIAAGAALAVFTRML